MKIYIDGWICPGCGYRLVFLNSREELPQDTPRTMECQRPRCLNFKDRVQEPIFEASKQMPTTSAAVSSYLTAK